mmetsp:Transcript_57629/g.146270  ORF Transcript_57629/g.146270 Transcript_57629/m.146270 type:complete len:645 (+) Transcript_57629:126-2060(+)
MQFMRDLLGQGDGVNLQSIFQNFPQQLLRQTGQGSDGPCHRKGAVSGDNQFHFTLHFERRSDYDGLCQTGVLVATALSAPGGMPVPVTCHWKRRIGAHLIEIPGIHGTMYHTSADDIGMDIVCQAEAVGDHTMGRAFGELGPFEVDPITRMNLENLISSGATSFPARHCRDQDDPHPRDLQIRVTQDFVKVVHPGADRDPEVVASYSADYPKVVLHPSDTCKFQLLLSEDQEKCYKFQALSRTSRDLIALLIRCFHARKYVATSFILSRLFQNPATPGAPLTSVQAQDFDLQGLGDRLGKELDRTVGQLEVVEKVVRNANMEKSELQAQLRETISSYTEAIEKLHTQLASAQGGPGAALQLQLHESRSSASKMQLELQELRQAIEEEHRSAPPKGGGAGGGGGKGSSEGGGNGEVEGLRGEIQQLRTRISALAGDQQDQNKRDLTRAEELRRLRADVDMLNSEKDALELNLVQAEKEKADLIENFVHVKGCLDKLQMDSLMTPAASPEHERQVAQLKANYSQVVEERNRLAARVDALDREREKQKQQRESALERVMNANARLLEERDKLEKEKARVSALYQSTMGAMGAVPQAGSAAGSGGEERCDQASLEVLKAELAQKTETLQKREQEGESLRARLRKLAMV